jgi:hypothetical protein
MGKIEERKDYDSGKIVNKDLFNSNLKKRKKKSRRKDSTEGKKSRNVNEKIVSSSNRIANPKQSVFKFILFLLGLSGFLFFEII